MSSEFPQNGSRMRRVDAFSELAAIAAPGERLERLRQVAPRFKELFVGQGQVKAVRTFDVAKIPYPVRYGLGGAASLPWAYLAICNRSVLVQFEVEGEIKNFLINPTLPEYSRRAPFFERLAMRYGPWLSYHVLSKIYTPVHQQLKAVGIDPADVDYLSFDHLHVQDLRPLIGTVREDRPQPAELIFEPLYPNALCIVQRRELVGARSLHPLQRPWYVPNGVDRIREDRLLIIDGDVQVGPGLAIIATPGHTYGNHSFLIHTERGVYAISENGIAADSYMPQHSRIPGLRKYARTTGFEVVLNSNTLEESLEQYTSMVKEKLLVDRNRENPEFLNHFASSELTSSWLAPGLAPTFAHTALDCGALVAKSSRSEEVGSMDRRNLRTGS